MKFSKETIVRFLLAMIWGLTIVLALDYALMFFINSCHSLIGCLMIILGGAVVEEIIIVPGWCIIMNYISEKEVEG